jgi:hypothetical protein
MLDHFLCEAVITWHVQCNFLTAMDVINNNTTTTNNNNSTVGQLVGVLKTSIISDLRLLVLLFRITYNCWSGHLILCHESWQGNHCIVLYCIYSSFKTTMKRKQNIVKIHHTDDNKYIKFKVLSIIIKIKLKILN